MGSKQQEASAGYMDGVVVKISEKYKPPPRIGLPMSYAQRLTLNKQMQDTIPSYDFALEKTVREKIREWRNCRQEAFKELDQRVEKAKNEFHKIVEERLEQQKQDAQEKEQGVIEATTKSNIGYVNSISNHSYQQPTQTMLIPTQVRASSVSNILTPIPLKEQNHNQIDYKSPDKSPFNISDFEADTSSPFDNMELKSINDMEELAQVLKGKPEAQPQIDFTPTTAANIANYPVIGANYNASYNIPCSSNFIHPATSAVYTNGYYYPPETIQSNPMFSTHFSSYSQYNKMNYCPSISDATINSAPIKSVPHIIRSLETELDNTHLDNMKLAEDRRNPKKVEPIPKVKTKSEDLEDFNLLPKSMQDLSRSISSMGFPLSRVARVCKILGSDQKKIVEHLLAMSELLDLGFPETSVSKALLECDNDRDRALDILIS